MDASNEAMDDMFDEEIHDESAYGASMTDQRKASFGSSPKKVQFDEATLSSKDKNKSSPL